MRYIVIDVRNLRLHCLASLSLLLLPSVLLFGQSTDRIIIEVTPPELQPGWAVVESLIAEAANSMLGEFQSMTTQLLDRPNFMGAFLRANAQTSLAASGLPLLPFDTLSLALGLSAGLQASPLAASTFEQFNNVTQDSDFHVGASVQGVNLQSAFNLGFILPGLEAGASVSAFGSTSSELSLQFFQAGGRLAWRFLPPSRLGTGATWSGLRLEAGLGWALNQLSTTIELDEITQSITFQLIPNSPFAAITVPLSIQPSIQAGLNTTSLQGLFQLSTGLDLGRFFFLQAGTGLSVYHAEGYLSVNMDEEVLIGGYFEDYELIVANPRLSITGNTPTTVLETTQAYLFAGLAFMAGDFRFELPVYYVFGDRMFDAHGDGQEDDVLGEGLSVSLLVGISL